MSPAYAERLLLLGLYHHRPNFFFRLAIVAFCGEVVKIMKSASISCRLNKYVLKRTDPFSFTSNYLVFGQLFPFRGFKKKNIYEEERREEKGRSKREKRKINEIRR